MKKILIIGANGHLGSVIKEKLKHKKNIILQCNYQKNLEKKTKCVMLLERLKPNIIINCAGYTDVQKCEINKKRANNSNFLLVKNLIQYLDLFKYKLIQISTDHLYDFGHTNNIETKSIIYNYYAKTKFNAEKICKKKNALIIRTNFFGYNKNKNKGIINWIINNKSKKILFSDIFFSPLYIDTLANIIIKILIRNNTGIYNIGTKDFISKKDFVIKISKKLKINLNYKIAMYKDRKLKKPKNMQMNINKFTKDFNIKLPSINTEINKLINSLD